MSLQTVFRTVGRWVRALLLAALALLAAGVLVLWWVNRQDEPLRPEVAQALAFSAPTPEAMRRNGYFRLLGLGAPPAEDAQAAGERFFAAQVRGYERFRATGEMPALAAQAYARQPVEPGPLRCDAEVADCYAHTVAQADLARQTLARYAVPVERYLALADAPQFEEVLPPYIGVEMPYYQDAVAASQLVGVRAALLWQGGQPRQALALLARDAQVQARMGPGAGTLVGAMIAQAMQVRRQRLLGAMLAHAKGRPLDAEGWRAAVGGSTADLSPALAGEARWTLAAVALVTRPFEPPAATGDEAPPTWPERARALSWSLLSRLSYLPHATQNQTWRAQQAMLALAALPASELDAAVAQAREHLPPASDERGFLPLQPRNMVGQMLLGMGSPDMWLTYIERAHDVEGHRRLLLLAIEARSAGVALADMPAWLAVTPAALRHPYTGQPMDWDAANATLRYQGRQPQPQNPPPRQLYRLSLVAPQPLPEAASADTRAVAPAR